MGGRTAATWKERRARDGKSVDSDATRREMIPNMV